MVTPEKPKTSYEKWQDTINQSITNGDWDGYDCDIMKIVGEFNRHLSGTKGYVPLNWKIIKAMVWTETGGPANASWNSRPMQIGNPGDPGLQALLSNKEGGELIIPSDIKHTLTIASAISSPQMNIRAGSTYRDWET